MGYPLPPYGRRPARRTEPQPDRVPAGLAVFEEQFQAKEFGSFGEFFAPSAPPAQTTRQQGLVIPPPPWVTGEEAPAGPQATTTPIVPGQALAEVKRRDGEEPFDPPPFGLPLVEKPLERFVPPEWPEEQRRAEALEAERKEAARRARIERALAEEESRRPSHPPRREPA